MPAFNFKEQFADDVADGSKRRTIRRGRLKPKQKVRVAPAKPGDILKLYTGMRHKSCRLLATARCTRVRGICLMDSEPAAVFLGEIDSVPILLPQIDAEELAKADGFASLNDMMIWFYKTHGPAFHGYLIEWEML